MIMLSFALSGYVASLVIKPRTSTWVACGAVVGVMLSPAAAIAMSFQPALAEKVPLLVNALVGYFRLLELSPFTLTGLAVSAALAGDWLGRELVAYLRVSERSQTLKPL